MKFKSFITLASGLLLVGLLLFNFNSEHNSAADKWTSFGLGMLSVIFISNLISFIALYKKKKSSQP